jgi:hypothetical protein
MVNNNMVNNNMVSNTIPVIKTWMDFSKNRKQVTTNILEQTEQMLYKFTNNNAISGFIIFLFHQIVCICLLYFTITRSLDLLFYITILCWIIIIFFHYYFNGCILIRLERYLWDTKTWYGQWTPLYNLLKIYNIELTQNLLNNMFICGDIVLAIFIIIKIVILI